MPFSFKSVMKPEQSVIASLATMGVVVAIWAQSTPNTATMQATNVGDVNIAASRRKALLTSMAAVFGLTLITHDSNIFILGGATVIALDLHARLANAQSPDTGKFVTGAKMQASGTQLTVVA